jgi:hypothetical protein
VKTTWPFLDFVAVLEQAGTEKALHARPQIDLFQRLGAPDELRLFGHRQQFRRLHQHRRRLPGLLPADGSRETQRTLPRRGKSAWISCHPAAERCERIL